MSIPFRPTVAELKGAENKVVADLIAPGLKVLFCGINPGLYSGATGHHFARPGNRFWPALHLAGFTERQVSPFDEQELLARGIGITNMVARTTSTAAQLSREELIAGGKILRRKVAKYKPKVVAFLGIGAYRDAFELPKATIGPQDARIADAVVWVLPNPSGLNAHFTVQKLAAVFRSLREAVEAG
jgi:TDG/mug DNA glycosylase family protein